MEKIEKQSRLGVRKRSMKNILSYIEGLDNIIKDGYINNCLSTFGHHSSTDDAGISRIFQELKVEGAVQ